MTDFSNTSYKTKRESKNQFKTFFSGLIPFLGLVFIIILLNILTEGSLLGPKNLMTMFNSFFSIGLGGMGVIFLMSIGETDLSLGAIVGFAAALAALAARTSVLLIFPVVILTGFLVGLINGIVISKLRVPSFIGTLAISFIFRGVTTVLLNGSIAVPLVLNNFDNDTLKIATLVLLLTTFFIIFEFTRFGKQCRAIGSSSEAAIQSGVNVVKVKLISYIISGLVCGLIAFFSIARTCTASNQTGKGLEFDVLLAVLIGGLPLSGGWQAKYRVVVIGCIAMAMIKSGMSLLQIDGLTQQLVQGFLFLVIVAVSFDRKNASIIK